MVVIILDEEEENEKNTMKRYGIHESLRKRKTEGESWILYRHLIYDEEFFSSIFVYCHSNLMNCLEKLRMTSPKETPFLEKAKKN